MDFLPGEGGLEFGVFGVALLGPEGVEGTVVGWAKGVVGGAVDGAEGGEADAGEGAGVGFAMGEECFADALAAILGEEDGLAEVADGVDVVFGFEEGVLELGAFVAEGEAGGGADDEVIIESEDDEAVGRTQVSAEVVALVVEGAVVEVGVVAEDGDAEVAEGVEVGGEGGAVEGFEAEGQGGRDQ